MPTSPKNPNSPDNKDAGEDLFGGKPKPSTERDEPSPGYETTDVNVGGVIVFLGGLAGFLAVFFLFCFVMGKVINSAFEKEDGPPNKWTAAQMSDPQDRTASASPAGGLRKNLASNPEMQQRELAHMTDTFPGPRLQTDDGNQDTADLHAREDLLLDHYSADPHSGGTLRIPIDRAMDLIAQRGLPLHGGAPSAAGSGQMIGDAERQLSQPLTNGFARTGYELDQMEARAQRLSYGKGEATQAENAPGH